MEVTNHPAPVETARYAVEWTWKYVAEESKLDETHYCSRIYDAETPDEAYNLWREMVWRELFDPYRVKLLSVEVSKIQ